MKTLQDLVWLWALLGFTIIPALKSFLTNLRRQQLIAKVERERGSKVITMAFA